jgi:hypothetical protein
MQAGRGGQIAELMSSTSNAFVPGSRATGATSGSVGGSGEAIWACVMDVVNITRLAATASARVTERPNIMPKPPQTNRGEAYPHQRANAPDRKQPG